MGRRRACTSWRAFWRMQDSSRPPTGIRCGAWLRWSRSTRSRRTKRKRMPEGDTIWRTARTLQRAIGGKVVTRFETVLVKLARVDDDTPIAGRTVESVESEG